MTEQRTGAGYGWTRDQPDFRDYRFAAPDPVLAALPAKIDLRNEYMPPIWAQLQTQSCVGQGAARVCAYALAKEGRPVLPSQLYLYYNGRDLENSTGQDEGCEIRDAIAAATRYGVASEQSWPFVPRSVTVRPSAAAYKEGEQHLITGYRRVTQALTDIKAALAAGFPVVFGFAVFDSFESDEVARTGIMPMPQPTESRRGGHCVVACGYDDSAMMVSCANSWSEAWGQDGYFQMPYALIADPNMASDFWTVTAVQP